MSSTSSIKVSTNTTEPALSLNQNWLTAIKRVLVAPQVLETELKQVQKYLAFNSENVGRLIASLLITRSLTDKPDLDSLLTAEPQLGNLPCGSRLKNMELAAATILQAWKNGQMVGVVGDYDADGITSVAQTILCGRALGYEHLLTWRVPNRFTDGYGINQGIADDLIRAGCKLVVLLDHGTKAHDTIEYLFSKGIASIVIDHHLPDADLPRAIVVNPEQPGCLFKDYKLCASGLTLFLTQKIAELAGQDFSAFGLAAIGTIADMVPVFGPNRNITKIGLRELRQDLDYTRPIARLALAMGLNLKDLNSSDLGFYLGPALNASGRLDDASKAVELLIAQDDEKQLTLASELAEINQNRKDIQRQVIKAVEEQISKKGSLDPVIIVSGDFHSGVVGLAASYLAKRYGRPAVVLSDKGEISSGSLRQGDTRCNLAVLLQKLKEGSCASAIVKFGGHAAAAGITIKSSKLELFKKEFNALYKHEIGENQKEIHVQADAELELTDLNARLVNSINKKLEPYGQGFDSPKLLFKAVEIIQIQAGERSIRLLLKQSAKEMWAFIGLDLFNNDLQEGDVINLIARPMMVFRKQKQTVQLSLEAYEVTELTGSVKERASAEAEWKELFSPQQNNSEDTSKVPNTDSKNQPDSDRIKLSQVTFDFFEPVPKAPAKVAKVVNTFKKRRAPNIPTYRELKNITDRFPNEYIYEKLNQDQIKFDPFRNSYPDEKSRKQEFIIEEELELILPEAFDYRAFQYEAVKYINNHAGNVLVDGPTGSGKTEIAYFLAARALKHSKSVLLVSPTIELASQTFKRAGLFFNEGVSIVEIADEPQERKTDYNTIQNSLWVGVPHGLKNDIKDLPNWPWSLLLIDEAHFTRGKYPYKDLIEHAIKNGTKVVLFSGSPVEPKSSKLKPETWDKLEQIKKLLGENSSIFVLGHKPRVIQITEIVSDYKNSFVNEKEILLEALQKKVAYIKERVEQIHLLDEEKEIIYGRLKDLLGSKSDKLPSGYNFRESGLLGFFKSFSSREPELQKLISSLHYIKELGEMNRRLTENGVYSCLIGELEQLCKVYFPCGEDPADYLKTIAADYNAKRFLNALSYGPFFNIWSKAGIEEALKITQEDLSQLSIRAQRRALNQALLSFKERCIKELSGHNYSDNPKEDEALSLIAKYNNSQGIVFVKEVEQVHFMVARINARLAEQGIKAVALTSKSGESTRRLITDKNIVQAFRNGKYNVLVCTSVGDQGIDIPRVDYGINYNFTAALIDFLQRSGRIGRSGDKGIFYFLSGSGADRGKLATVNRKYKLNLERCVTTREEILSNDASLKHNDLYY